MNSDPNSLSEFNIGGVTLPNRSVRTAHLTMLGIYDPTGMGETSFKICDPFGVVSIYDDQVMVS